MRLIVVYGPPAAGKLTVARQIAALTGYKVFHNHLSIDCIEPIFEFGSPSFGKLINLIRVETITEAARTGVNLIYTFCYAKDADDRHIEEIVGAVESHGGEICFVLLTCKRAELEKRILEESRKRFGKANNLKILNELLDKYDFSSPVPQRASLQIDNTDLSPQETAQKIVSHFELL